MTKIILCRALQSEIFQNEFARLINSGLASIPKSCELRTWLSENPGHSMGHVITLGPVITGPRLSGPRSSGRGPFRSPQAPFFWRRLDPCDDIDIGSKSGKTLDKIHAEFVKAPNSPQAVPVYNNSRRAPKHDVSMEPTRRLT